MNRNEIGKRLTELARELTASRRQGATDLPRRLNWMKEELSDIVDEVDQVLTFMDISDNQRKALTEVSNHCERAEVQVNRAMKG